MVLKSYLIILIATVSSCSAVVNTFKRREASLSGNYGPPPLSYGSPAPVYGVPIAAYGPPMHNREPHKEYGLPQALPQKEYGIPSNKYGPPLIHAFGQNSLNKNNFHEQIKSHFGLHKPVYGPPHIQKVGNFIQHSGHNSLSSSYGPPPSGPIKAAYGPPKIHQNYGPPPVPQLPKPVYGLPPLPPKQLPAPVYGVPALGHPSGPSHNSFISHKPILKPIYTLPPSSYGVPNGPIALPQQQIIQIESHGSQNVGQHVQHVQHGQHGQLGQHIQHVQQGQHGGLAVSCDGWRPIPGPVEQPIDSHLLQSQNYATAYNGGGLTDAQLVAVALQSGLIDGPQQHLPIQPALNFNGGNHHVNSDTGVQVLGAVADSYTQPPPDSYAPNSIHALKYNTLNGNVNGGLVPPSGVYGVPPSGSYGAPQASSYQQSGLQAGLAIQYGTVSGNLQPGPIGGTAPRKPVSFRPPVPEGLLESIGQTVQHLDQYGVKPPNPSGTYIPPPLTEIPQHNSINIEEQNLLPYASENVAYQALPSGQEPRFNQPQDCGHGPNLVGANINYDFNSNKLSNQNFISTGFDNIGYESKQSPVTVSKSVSAETQVLSELKSNEPLPGLEGLNVLSAEKSQSVTIPVQGKHGTYHLQFQNADPAASPLNGDHQANHEQILSQGLLQSVLSAIEQPNESAGQSNSIQDRADHETSDELSHSLKETESLDKPIKVEDEK